MQEREDLILNPVPKEERTGWGPPLFNILGCNIAISELMVGGALIAGMALKGLIIASIIGNLLLVLILSIQGYIGSKEGLNTYVLAKGAFGEIGGKWIISLMLGITSFGWFGIQAGVAGLSVQKIFPGINLTLAIIILGLLMVIVAVYGFKTMALFNYIAIPPLIILMIWGLAKTLGSNGVQAIANYTPAGSMTLIEGVNMVVGLIIVGAIISPDYTRYTKGFKDILIVGFVGFAIISIFQQVAAGIIAMQAPTWDITEVLANLGFHWIAFVILLLAAWSTNLSNAYSGGLALKNVLPNQKRKTLTFVAGIIGTAIAASGIIFRFQNFLSILSMTVPSIAGIMWVEYYFIRKRKLVIRQGINWIAIISWIIGFLISYITTNQKLGLPPINGIICSGIVYYVLELIFDKEVFIKESEGGVNVG
ncbi:MAG: cytosine permease [Clostridia bacterium]|nr:cytosine permease [Clostridia bacterium]